MKKRCRSLIITVCMICCLTMTSCSAVEIPAANSGASAGNAALLSETQGGFAFDDVPADAWYASAVNYCQQHGIMNGTTPTTFAPEDPLTRAMLAAVLYRMSGSPAAADAPTFTDAAAGAWYSNAVSWAAESKVISGYGNGTFGVNDFTTREQAVTILWRYAGSPGSSTTGTFSEAGSISGWAKAAVRWANASGILDGMTENNRFDPGMNIKRGEAASMFYQCLNLKQQTAADSENPGGFDLAAKSVTLNSGYEMPINGLGTYSLRRTDPLPRPVQLVCEGAGGIFAAGNDHSGAGAERNSSLLPGE